MTYPADGRMCRVEYAEVARARSPRGEIVLGARGHVLELRVNGTFVMDTAETSSERALATLALGRPAAPRAVLVGGLGLGFTVREVLARPGVEEVTAVEIEPALVGWLLDGTVPHGPALLADDRLRVVVADVATVLGEADAASYDVVLLDVDNGPDQLVHETNAAVYTPAALQAVRRVLRPGGVLAVWSAHRAPGLLVALGELLAEPEEAAYEVELQGRHEEYLVYLASRPPDALLR